MRAVGAGAARSAVAYVLAALLAGAASAAEGGRLEAMRQEVRGGESDPDDPGTTGNPSTPANPSTPGNHGNQGNHYGHANHGSHCSHCSHGNHGQPDNTPSSDGVIVVESDLGDVVGMVVLEGVAAVLASPFTIPRAAMSDDGWRRGQFTRYPYSDGPGYLSVPGGMNGNALVGGHRDVACSAALAYAKDDAVETYRGDFQLRTSARAGLRLTYTGLVEDLGGGTEDTLGLGDATVLVRFAQHEKAQMRFGIGYLSMPDEGEDGAIFVYEGDFFPVEPIVVSAGVDVGGLGDATYSRWHLGVGVACRNVEFSLGYSSLHVGSVELEGPTLGSRVWF
jgi:hypothetical protein